MLQFKKLKYQPCNHVEFTYSGFSPTTGGTISGMIVSSSYSSDSPLLAVKVVSVSSNLQGMITKNAY